MNDKDEKPEDKVGGHEPTDEEKPEDKVGGYEPTDEEKARIEDQKKATKLALHLLFQKEVDRTMNRFLGKE